MVTAFGHAELRQKNMTELQTNLHLGTRSNAHKEAFQALMLVKLDELRVGHPPFNIQVQTRNHHVKQHAIKPDDRYLEVLVFGREEDRIAPDMKGATTKQ